MREMKDSGIEWIGAIPQDWKTDRLQWHLKEINVSNNPIQTKNILSLTIEAGVIPYAEKGNQGNKAKEDYSQYKIAFPDTLVINSMNVIIGAVGISQYFGCVSPVYYVFEPIEGTDLRYIYYLFTNTGFQKEMRKYAKGILEIRLRISSNDMLKRIVPSPPFKEQQRIADYLDKMCAEIDTVLEKTRASIEEYKKLKQAVITQAVTKGIRGDRPMKDSGIEWIGEIPAEWKVNLIKNVATTGSGGTPESGNPSLYDGDINWICSYDLKERPITKSERRLTQLGADSIAGNVQLKGSVLVAMYGGSGTIGNSGILECEAKTNQAICSIKFNNGYITDYFGFYYILSIRKCWMIFAVGTRKDPNISQDIVRKMPCILPPIAEQEEIVAYCNKACDQLDTLITKKQQYLTEIENYKKSLIYEYVTGKKEVKTSVLAD